MPIIQIFFTLFSIFFVEIRYFATKRLFLRLNKTLKQ